MMKTAFVVLVCVPFASAAYAGFFERLHNNIDEGVRELCARKPDLCKKLDTDRKRNADVVTQNPTEPDQINQRTHEK